MANLTSSVGLLPWLSLVGLYLAWAWPCLVAYLMDKRRRAYASREPYILAWVSAPIMALLIVDIFSRCSPSDLSACSAFGRAALTLAQ